MTNRYIAVVSASEEQRYASRQSLLERERDFFLGNALLLGLRPDRWGTPTLKSLIVRLQVRFAFTSDLKRGSMQYMCVLTEGSLRCVCVSTEPPPHLTCLPPPRGRGNPTTNKQCNAIVQSIPDLSRRLHVEIDEMEEHVKASGRRIEDHKVYSCPHTCVCDARGALCSLFCFFSSCFWFAATGRMYLRTITHADRPPQTHRRHRQQPQPQPHTNTTQEFFTKLCADTAALAFEIEDLATSAATRPVRHLNLGARISATIRSHEAEVRRCLGFLLVCVRLW